MPVYGLDHVLIAIPMGALERARGFYCGLLGLAELPKPAPLASRGGAWLELGSLQLHLGEEKDFAPARRAHPALRVRGLAELLARCEESGCEIRHDVPLEGRERAFVFDPFGNRIELIELGSEEMDG
jgi:catechol 2,3-dioxygenase-like lactoylglutathione lyase family enzyme